MCSLFCFSERKVRAMLCELRNVIVMWAENHPYISYTAMVVFGLFITSPISEKKYRWTVWVGMIVFVLMVFLFWLSYEVFRILR